MHETSLGQTITDYLTGQQIENTTFEDIRQTLAQIMVEEKGYPKDKIQPKKTISIPTTDGNLTITLDFVIYDDQNNPILLLTFVPGEVVSFIRQYIAAARLHQPVIPLVVITDTQNACLVQTADKKIIERGYFALPNYKELKQLAANAPVCKLNDKIKKAEICIANAYFSLSGPCTNSNQCTKSPSKT